MPEDNNAIRLNLTSEERAFAVSLLAANPPASDGSGSFTASREIEDWPAREYRAASISLDDKLRSADVVDLPCGSRESD